MPELNNSQLRIDSPPRNEDQASCIRNLRDNLALNLDKIKKEKNLDEVFL
jgi:hypothetical protein